VVKPLTVGLNPWEAHELGGYDDTTNEKYVIINRVELAIVSTFSTCPSSPLRSQSRFLIVVCSPNAAKSVWVNEEIETFECRDHMLCLIVDGEPNTSQKNTLGQKSECFPEAIRISQVARREAPMEGHLEPLAADIRKGKDGRLAAKIKIVSGMLGVGFDVLYRRAVRRRHRLIASWVFAACLIVLSTSAVYLQIRRQILQASRSDLVQAQQELNRGNADFGIAYLARSIRENQDNSNAQESLLLSAPTTHFANLLAVFPRNNFSSDFERESSLVSSDGTYFLTVDPTNDGKLFVFDLLTGQRVCELTHDSHIESAQFDIHSDNIVTASSDGTARIWDVGTGKALAVLKHENSVMFAKFSPDGSEILTCMWNARSVFLWDAKSGKRLAVLDGTFEPHKTGGFSPDGSKVVTMLNNTAFLWDAKTGRQLGVFGHDSQVTSVVLAAS
jgi:hypothetical protein